MVRLLRGGGAAQAEAMHAVHNLARCVESRRAVAAAAEAVAACVDVLRSPVEETVKEHAAATVAALCDACDCLVHAFVCVAHASDAFDHHAVHVAEERGIRLALLGFACAVVGEIASNNRVGRALSALTHHRKQD